MLIIKLSHSLTATAQTASALTVRLQPDCFFSLWIQRSQAEMNVSGSNEALYIYMVSNALKLLIFSSPQSLSFSACFLFPHRSALLSPFRFIPAPRFLPILKPLPCIDFLSALLSSGVFRSSLWESILFNSCHTERFCSLSWGSGETLCQTEKRGRVESLHGCWLEAVYFPLSSSLASNRLWIWSLHI